jgi:hypothetical protein
MHDDVPAERCEGGAGRGNTESVEDGRGHIGSVIAQDRAGIREERDAEEHEQVKQEDAVVVAAHDPEQPVVCQPEERDHPEADEVGDELPGVLML